MSVLELEAWGSPAAEDGLGEYFFGSVFVLIHRRRLKLAHAQMLLLKETLGLTGFPMCYCSAKKKKERILAQPPGAEGSWGASCAPGGAAQCPALQQCCTGFQRLIRVPCEGDGVNLPWDGTTACLFLSIVPCRYK